MQITRQSEYAIRSLIELSKAPYGQLLHTKDISEKQEIPEVFLKKTIQLLTHAGLVSTQRGAYGGVRLSRPSDQITIADVLLAVEGQLGINVCLQKGVHCPNKPTCPVHPILKRAQEALLEELNRETFADIVARDVL